MTEYIYTTKNGSRFAIKDDGVVEWIAQSSDSKRYDSLIRIPPREDIRDFAGVADALRIIADHIEGETQ